MNKPPSWVRVRLITYPVVTATRVNAFLDLQVERGSQDLIEKDRPSHNDHEPHARHRFAAAPATSSTWASPPTPSGLPFAGSYVASGVLSSYVSSRVLSVCVLSRVLSSPGQLTRKANPFPTRTHAHKLYLSLPHAPTDAFHPALFVLFFESLGGMLNAGLARALSHTHALTHRGTNASLPASPRGSRGAIAASGGRGARNGHVRRVRAEPYPRRSVEV